MTYEDKIFWAIVGLGKHAEVICDAIKKSYNGNLVAVISKDKDRAKQFMNRYEIPTHLFSVKDLSKTKNINSLFISSPNHRHAKEAISAIKANKNVLCEKPLAISIKEGNQIKSALKENAVTFSVGFHLRHEKLIQKAKNILLDSTIGEIKYIELQWLVGSLGKIKLPPLMKHMKWRENYQKSGGGSIMARGVHLFDLLRYLTGQEIEEVYATMDLDKKIDSTTIGLCRIGGAYCTIVTSRIIPLSDNIIKFYGSDGRLSLYDACSPNEDGRLEIITHEKKDAQVYQKTNLYVKEIQDFGEMVLNGRKTSSATLDDGLKTINITEAFFNSARKGRLIKVTY